MSKCDSMKYLAKVGRMRLARCSCGSLHLALPHATLHFDQEGIEDLHSLLGVALRKMAKAERSESPLGWMTRGSGETLQ